MAAGAAGLTCRHAGPAPRQHWCISRRINDSQAHRAAVQVELQMSRHDNSCSAKLNTSIVAEQPAAGAAALGTLGNHPTSIEAAPRSSRGCSSAHLEHCIRDFDVGVGQITQPPVARWQVCNGGIQHHRHGSRALKRNTGGAARPAEQLQGWRACAEQMMCEKVLTTNSRESGPPAAHYRDRLRALA